jgi:hypothetical protein|tara:strand:- start:883 stop:1191 length:309 start_codon:yes stop_codon:yes gene_type:complete
MGTGLSEEFLEQWEDLVEGVDKKDVPIECIKRVVLRLKDGKRRYFNMSTLRKQGLNIHELEFALNEKLKKYDKDIDGVDFFVDVESVAGMVQPGTDEILGKL